VHIHDVFIWYFPFRIIYWKTPVFVTYHGWEEIYPIPYKSIFINWISSKLSFGTITIGKYVEKYYRFKSTLLCYGASVISDKHNKKNKKNIVCVGRLEENTGLLKFLNWLKKNPKYKVDFCGDGRLRTECEKYGTVHGFCNPNPFYKKAEYCVPGGYLAALEALSYNCKLKLYWNNKVKEDYWKMSPFYKLKGEKLKEWAKKQTWEKLADEYLALYHSKK
jgi:hypothetical protein